MATTAYFPISNKSKRNWNNLKFNWGNNSAPPAPGPLLPALCSGPPALGLCCECGIMNAKQVSEERSYRSSLKVPELVFYRFDSYRLFTSKYDCFMRLMWIQDELPVWDGQFVLEILQNRQINRWIKSNELYVWNKNRPVLTSRRIVRLIASVNI